MAKVSGCKHHESKMLRMAEGGAVPAPAKEYTSPGRQFGRDALFKALWDKKKVDEGYNRITKQAEDIIKSDDKPSRRPEMPWTGYPPAKKSTSAPPKQSERQAYSPPEAPKPTVPKPKLRPRPTSYTVKEGDNPTKIARAMGMTLKELEAKNPGLLRRARRMKIGSTVNV